MRKDVHVDMAYRRCISPCIGELLREKGDRPRHRGMCPHMRLDTRLGMCACMCICTCMHICMHMCILICTDICMDMCADVRKHVCTHMCAHVCADMCIDMCIDVCIDMCIGREIDGCLWMGACTHIYTCAKSGGVFGGGVEDAEYGCAAP